MVINNKMAKMIKEAQMHELNTIKEQINKGESLYIEFKEFFSKANDIAAEIVAFAIQKCEIYSLV